VEEFSAKAAAVEVSDVVEIESEAVEGFHADAFVVAEVVGVFDPFEEEGVELCKVVDGGEVLDEELITDGAKEAFYFSFGGSVSHWGVDKNGAESLADVAELFGGVVGAVVGVDGFGDAAFVEGVLEAEDEGLGIVSGEELSVGNHSGGVVYKADEVNLCGFWRAFLGVFEWEVGAVEGIDLPEVIGVGFSKGEALFIGGNVVFGFEEIVCFDSAAKGGGGDLFFAEKAFFDAEAVKSGDVVSCIFEEGFGFFDGFEKILGGGFTHRSFVGAFLGVGQSMLAIVIPPGLDGAPGELVREAFFIFEDHLADGLILFSHGSSWGVFEGSEDFHFDEV